MRRICFLNQHYYKKTIGGAEVQIYLLAQEFLRNGWEVHHVVEDVTKEEIDQGMFLHPFKRKGSINRSFSQLSQLLDSIDAHIHYQRGRKLLTGLLGMYSKESAKPFIFAASMDIDCRKYKQITRGLSSNANAIKKMLNLPRQFKMDTFTLKGMKRASMVLCQSVSQKEQLKNNLNIESRLFRNIHPVPQQHETEKHHPPTVLWLASIKAWKRPEIFMNLVNDLRHLDCAFLLAGRIQESKYKSQIRSIENHVKNFKYIEDVPFEKSNNLIAMASIFVNTSLPYEGFPNTFIQAWLRKTPVVTLSFDPDDIIKKQQIGFHSRTYDQLLRDVTSLVKDRTQRKEMGRRAREYAIADFSVEKHFKFLLNIITSVLD